MMGSKEFTDVFGLVGAGDQEHTCRVVRAAVAQGWAVVLNWPLTKRPMCTLSRNQRVAADRAAQREAAEAGKNTNGVKHACGLVGHALTNANDPKGLKAEATVRRLGRDVNVGLELGASRLVVVDVDTVAERTAFLTDWAARSGSDQSHRNPTVESPGVQRSDGEWMHSGGGHWWFTLPDGVELPPGMGAMKAEAGYTVMWNRRQVLVPPSRRAEGPYRLVGGTEECPGWLLDMVVAEATARNERARAAIERATGGEPGDIDKWSAVTPWGDLLGPDGWTETGLVDGCSCPIWTAPGDHASPKSATAHDAGCARFVTAGGWGPLHIWTDNVPEYLGSGAKTLTKLQYVARRDHGGKDRAAMAALGLLAEAPEVSVFDPYVGPPLGVSDSDNATDQGFSGPVRVSPGQSGSVSGSDTAGSPGESGSVRVASPEDDDQEFCVADAVGDPGQRSADPFDLPPEVSGDEVMEEPAAADPVLDPVDAFLATLLGSAALDGIPDPVPLVEGVMDLNTVIRVIGKPGCKKSFLMLDLANCVATGKPWHGAAVKQGPVVYMVAEGVTGIKKRQRAWELEFNGGERVPDGMLLFIPYPVQTKDAKHWTVMRKALRRIGPSLVILDTQARITVGAAENDATEMGEMIERVEQVRRDTGACVTLVHHLGHSGEQGRGSSAVLGAIHGEIRVSADGPHRVQVFNDKQKDQAQFAPIALDVKESGDSIVLVSPGEGDPFSTAHRSEDRPEVDAPGYERVFFWLRKKFPNQGATKAELWKVIQDNDRGPNGVHLGKSQFYWSWDKLAHEGRILNVEIDGHRTARFVTQRDGVRGE